MKGRDKVLPHGVLWYMGACSSLMLCQTRAKVLVFNQIRPGTTVYWHCTSILDLHDEVVYEIQSAPSAVLARLTRPWSVLFSSYQ